MALDSSTLIIAVVVIGLIILAGAIFGYVVYRSTRRPPQAGAPRDASAPTLHSTPRPSAPPPPSTPRQRAPGGADDQTQTGTRAARPPSAPPAAPSPAASEPTREISRPVVPAPASAPPPSPKREAKNLFGSDKEAAPASPAPLAQPSPAQAEGGPSAIPPTSPALSTEDVRFSAYYPKEANIEQWYTLLVYAHLDSALAQVQADAARYKEEMGGAPRQAQSSTPAHIARGTEITLLPECEGVEFNPERITFKWVEDMHRNEFRMRAKQSQAGLAGNATVTVFVGPVIVATIKFGMLFGEAASAPVSAAPPVAAVAQMYKAEQIFISRRRKSALRRTVERCTDAPD